MVETGGLFYTCPNLRETKINLKQALCIVLMAAEMCSNACSVLHVEGGCQVFSNTQCCSSTI